MAITQKLLLEAKGILDKFINESPYYGIFSHSVVKTIFFNREIGAYSFTIKDKTFNGFRVPVTHIEVIDGKPTLTCDNPSAHVSVWYDNLFNLSEDSQKMRQILGYYMLAWYTGKASGNGLAGIYFTLLALQKAKFEYPDKIEITRNKLTHMSVKADYPKMIDSLRYFVEGNRQRIENDPTLSSYYGIERVGKTVTTSTVTTLKGLANLVEF